MPVYQIGDLVQTKEVDDDSIGFIVDMRAGPMHPEANVKWSDMPEPFWIHISSLALVQTEQPVVE
jgi:hypothetical protein